MMRAATPNERDAVIDPVFEGDAWRELLAGTEALADTIANRPSLGTTGAPLHEMDRCAALGLLTATLPRPLGGLGIGVDPGTQLQLLRLLAALGGGDLALGRLYEGHVNGLLLIQRYGTAKQIRRAAADASAGMWFGVWNTGSRDLLQLSLQGDASFRFDGVKTFATGASFIRRPIVTAQMSGTGMQPGWQMTCVSMEKITPVIDRSFWHPLGMESSESYGVDFSGCCVDAEDLIGAPGDFYRDPLFHGGAIRFAAVHAGAVCRLHQKFAEWLQTRDRLEDVYQIARLGETAMLAQESVLWIEKAAAVAESSLFGYTSKQVEVMTQIANMTRLSVERIGTQMMQKVMVGVGAQGLLQPHRFERIIRDLTMYLRQPAPDQTLASVGKAAAHQMTSGSVTRGGVWAELDSTLSPEYFERIYDRDDDPWNFASSSYEADKYGATLESLPRWTFARGLEIGCSIGVLTARLADRCDELIAVDVSERALDLARERCADKLHVLFARMQVPRQMPDGGFDLIVVSEVAYYWQMNDLERAAEELAQRQRTGGILVLVHWTPAVADNPLTGDEVHDFWTARPEWRPIKHLRRDRFRLDVLERCDDQLQR